MIEALGRHEHDFIAANYANADMVGHTGVWSAAVEAANVLDGVLGRLARAALGEGADLVITADHGNIEEMRDESGAPQTKHTTSPVPFVLVSEANTGAGLRDGELADVGPTLCELFGIEPGPDMTGRSLLIARCARVYTYIPRRPASVLLNCAGHDHRHPRRPGHPGDRAHCGDPAPAAWHRPWRASVAR